MSTHNEPNATSGCWAIAIPLIVAIVVVVIIGAILLGRAHL